MRGMFVSAAYGLPDHGSLWRQMAKLRTTIPRAPYAPRACSAGRVPAGSGCMRICTPEPCAQVRILLGAHRTSNFLASHYLLFGHEPDLGPIRETMSDR